MIRQAFFFPRALRLLLLCFPSFVAGVGGAFFLSCRATPTQEQQPQQQQPDRIVCKEIQVESLVLVDRAGKQIGWLRPTGAHGATFALGYGRGNPMVVMQVDEIEGTPRAILTISAPKSVSPSEEMGSSSIGLTCDSWPQVSLLNPDGCQIRLGSDVDHPETALVLREHKEEKAKWPK